MIAYLITNKVNGKKYVGITTRTLARRWWEHVNLPQSCGKALHAAIKKYSPENFMVEQIASGIGAIDNLKALETQLIIQYDTYKKGYNSTLGGDGVFGYKRTEESKKQQSEKMRGRKASEETRKKMSISQFGKSRGPLSEDAKKRISETKKGVSVGLNKPKSETHKQNVSKGLKKYFETNEPKSGNVKGLIIATDLKTNKQFILDGKKDIETKGFDQACVYRCVNGQRKSHHNHIFKRI